MKNTNNHIAQELLSHTELNITDAVRLVVEMIEWNTDGRPMKRQEALRLCRRIIQMGSEAYRLSEKTVKLSEAIDSLLEQKKEMRDRTWKEIRQICTRFVGSMPGFGDVPIRTIGTAKCEEALNTAFTTLPSRKKCKRIIHSLFVHAENNGWCTGNPMAAVHLPRHKEKPVRALKIDEVVALLRAAQQPEHILCAPAVGIMLWAGIRPHEVERLQVRHINMEDKVITVPAAHAKTGGARQVTMHPVLMHWLRKTLSFAQADAPIVPGSWAQRWAQLRKAAGFEVWSPDVLRHTFASYHIKYFRDMGALQLEMGHSTPTLLRTRYLAMEGVTTKAAKLYWNYDLPRRRK